MRNVKLYNIFFPVCLINIFPIIILILLPINFLLNTIILLVGLKILKVTNIKSIYEKVIFKIWVIDLIINFIGILIMSLTQYFGNIPFVYDNFTLPIAINPFSNIYAIMYCAFVIILCSLLIYFLNKKISFINSGINEKSKRILSFLLALLTTPYFFCVPSNIFTKDDYQSKLNKLEQYRDSYSYNEKAISNIINNLDSKDYIIKFNVENTNNLPIIVMDYKENVLLIDVYKVMEEDASIIFNLVKDIKTITYRFNNESYSFYYDEINKIFDNKIKDYHLEAIKERYKDEKFNNAYLGNINGLYDLFDESTICSKELDSIYEDNNYKYLVSCSQIDYLYLIDNEDNRILLKDAINNNIITINDLSKTILAIHKEKK